MSLIEENSKPLSLRVFKRSAKHLVLLWRQAENADPLDTTITFTEIKSGSKPIVASKIMVDEKVDSHSDLKDLKVSSDTVVCVLSEEENGLDPKASYYVRVEYNGLQESIRLTPAGVFPSHEREDRKKNVHIMLWDDENSVWRKASGVRGKRGRFFMGAVIVPCPGCGFEVQTDQ